LQSGDFELPSTTDVGRRTGLDRAEEDLMSETAELELREQEEQERRLEAGEE